jgi:hypothetical protein
MLGLIVDSEGGYIHTGRLVVAHSVVVKKATAHLVATVRNRAADFGCCLPNHLSEMKKVNHDLLTSG